MENLLNRIICFHNKIIYQKIFKMKYKKKIKSISKKLSLTFTSLVTSLLIIEIIFHLPIPYFESFFDRNKNTNDWYYLQDGKRVFLINQTSINFKNTGNLYLHHSLFTCGNTGLTSCTIDICNYINKSNDIYRIAFIGQSVASAMYAGEVVNPNKIFTSIIQDRLKKLSKNNLQFEVFNFGTGGANLDDIAYYFKYISKCKPDLIVYLFAQNDLSYRGAFHVEPYAKYKYSNKWYHRTRSFYFLNSIIHDFLMPLRFFDPISYRTAEKLINQIRYYNNNSKFFIINLPYFVEGYKYDDRFIKPYSIKYNISYLDLREVFIQKDIDYMELRAEPSDYAHFGYKGNKIVADIIYEQLLKNNLLPINKT